MSILIKIDTNTTNGNNYNHFAINQVQLTDNIAEQLAAELQQLIIESQNSIIIDFSKVENISEAVLFLIVDFEEVLNEKPLFLGIYGCSENVQDQMDGFELLQFLAPNANLNEAIEEIEADKASLLNDFDV